jgi:hypothetical protein
MTEQKAEDIRYLTEVVGMPEDVARLRLQDNDLWVLDPGSRFDECHQGGRGGRAPLGGRCAPYQAHRR